MKRTNQWIRPLAIWGKKKMRKLKTMTAIILTATLCPGLLGQGAIWAFAEEESPQPFWSVDFNNGYADIADDPLFQEPNPQTNPAAPELVEDQFYGKTRTVLKLNKSCGDEVWATDYAGAKLLAGYTNNSTIELTNPFSLLGENYFRESWYTEKYDFLASENDRLHVKKFNVYYQPLWENGATMNYWVKVPAAQETDAEGRVVGINSALFSWELDDIQFQADDYAKYLSGQTWQNPGYGVLPRIDQETGEYEIGSSAVRFAKTHGSMQIDSDSSIYWNNDDSFGINLNENVSASYGTRAGMQNGDCFFMNSWQESKNGQDADSAAYLAASPYSEPDVWHMVTVTLMNDWVEFYLDGEIVNVRENYSSRGGDSLDMDNSFKRFNKGTGMRYSFGSRKQMGNIEYGNYVCRLFLDWLTNPKTTFAIGGVTVKNAQANMYNMSIETDEVELAGIDIYSTVLSDAEILSLYEEETVDDSQLMIGDVDGDQEVTAIDALMVLKHVVNLTVLEEPSLQAADTDQDGFITAADALCILKYVVGLIDTF